MRSLAASFESLSSAQRALAALQDAVRRDPMGLRIAPLGHASYPVHEDSVVAGRFDEGDVAEVRAIIERFGGSIVTDVDTRRT